MAIIINSAWDEKLFKAQRERDRQSVQSNADAEYFYMTYGGHGYEGDWGSEEYYKRVGHYLTYNPITRKWETSTFSNVDASTFSSNLSSLSLSPSSSGVLSQIGVVDASTDAKTNSKKKAEKDYIEVEFNTLTGELQLIPTKDNMRIKPNTTIALLGVGKYLSGLYFVSEVRKSMSTDGYSLSVTLYKNGFGTSLNLKGTVPYSDTTTNRPNEINIMSNTTSAHLKVGDKVKIVGEAVYSDVMGSPIPESVKQKEYVIDSISVDGIRAKLRPLNESSIEQVFWTYTKFIQTI